MNAIQTLLTDHIAIWTDADTEKKSGRGRSSGNAASAYGIRKLRELILEFAMHGTLVSQNSEDEPASVLLKRIQVNKSKLIAEGKSKPLPKTVEDGKPYALPQGWEWTNLASLAKLIRGVSYSKHEASEVPIAGHVTLLRANNIGRGLNFDKLLFLPQALISDDQYLRRGDFLIAMSSGSADLVGKAAHVSEDIEAAFGAFCAAVRPNTQDISPYLNLYLQSPLYRNAVSAQGKGIGINNLQKGSVEGMHVPLPPLTEQHRIVAKVDELMALCDQLETRHNNAAEAHEKLVSHLLATLTQSQSAPDFSTNWQRIAAHFDTLFTTEASIAALKQTLLQLAVMGKLVPQYPNDEPARALLKRIQAEKSRLIAEGKIKQDKPLPPILEDEKPFDLPKGWGWARFNDLINPAYQISYGVLVPGADEGDGIPFVRIADLDIKNPPENPKKSISREIDSQYERTRLEGGEILMGVVGSIGKLGVAPNSWKGANIARAICRIKVSDFLSRDFIVTLLQSRFMQNNFIGDTKTLAQPTLNIGLIRLSLTPLPPISEQHRIVAKVDELMALCDQLKTRLADVNQLQQKLADVVVEQAVA